MSSTARVKQANTFAATQHLVVSLMNWTCFSQPKLLHRSIGW